MGDLDRVDAGVIEGGDDAGDVGRVDTMADGVHPVSQGDVLDVERGHAGAPSVSTPAESSVAIRSAVCMAAEVMMSRFPA